MPTVTKEGYVCNRCESFHPAASPWADDKPEGYYVNVRRVTEHQNHWLSDEVFLCSKECFLDYVQYGISHSTLPVRPIGRRRK